MKKLLLTSIALFIGMAAFAQHHSLPMTGKSVNETKQGKRISIANGIATIGVQQSNPYVNSKSFLGDSLGETWYDLQTNKCVQNRIVKHSDGTISAAWTMSDNSGFADRGTGYNYYNGTSWSAFPLARIEPVRVGWPSMTVSNGNEVVITHSATSLYMATRTKGTGTWTSAPIAHTSAQEQTWPRAMGAGLTSQKIHLIATDYTGSVANGILYSRSTDGGATWDLQNIVLPGTNPVTELLPTGADSYAMDVKGDTVAIVTGDMTSDIVLCKSIDGGTSWTSQIVFQHPIHLWNTSLSGDPAGTSDVGGDGTAPDTLTVCDGRLSVVIGNDGVIHVFFGTTKIARGLTEAADFFTYWSHIDGVVYWNTTMPIIVPQIYFEADTLLNKVGYMVDRDGSGTIDFSGSTPDIGDYPFTGLSSMPSCAVGSNNDIYCTYSSVAELTDFGDGRAFRHIYAVKSTDNGATWSEPVDLTPDVVTESVFGSLNRTVDTDLHMVYQLQTEPGNSLQPSTGNIHVAQNNATMYLKKNKDLTSGIDEISSSNFSINQNYPNPFSTSTTIKVDLKQATTLSIEVTNLIGQQILKINKGNVGTGTHTFTINRNQLEAGIYFYTVKAGENKMTKKMIVE